MGRKAVRLAIQEAIQSAGIDMVGTVFPARPSIIQEEAYVQTLSGQAVQEAADGSACVLVVNVPKDERTPYALAGRGPVADFNVHTIAIELFFACISGHGVAAQLDYDQIVDDLTVFIRGNPTMSAPATVWSAGEYRFGVRHTQEEPYQSEDGTSVLINGTLRFEAWEQDVGIGV